MITLRVSCGGKKSYSKSEADRTAPHFGSSAVRGSIEPDHIERAVSAARASGWIVAVISTADAERWRTNQAYREEVRGPAGRLRQNPFRHEARF